MRYGCHVWTIRLKERSFPVGHLLATLLANDSFKRQHTAYAQHEFIKRKQFSCLFLIASETMEHATRQILFIFVNR